MAVPCYMATVKRLRQAIRQPLKARRPHPAVQRSPGAALNGPELIPFTIRLQERVLWALKAGLKGVSQQHHLLQSLRKAVASAETHPDP